MPYAVPDKEYQFHKRKKGCEGQYFSINLEN